MTKILDLKVGSNGYIFDQASKNKEQKALNSQIDAFFKQGGSVTKVPHKEHSYKGN